MRTTARIISALLALLLAVGGVLVAIEVLVARLGRQPVVLDHPRWAHYARTNAWSSPSFRWLMVLACVAGVVLVAMALAHRRPLTVETAGVGTPTRITVQRSTLEGALADEARRVDGISGARVHIDKGVAHLRATSNRHDTDGLDSALKARADDRLAAWGLTGRLEVRPKVAAREQA